MDEANAKVGEWPDISKPLDFVTHDLPMISIGLFDVNGKNIFLFHWNVKEQM